MKFLVVFEVDHPTIDGRRERYEVVEQVRTPEGCEHIARRKLMEEHLNQNHQVKLISRDKDANETPF